MKTYHIEAVLTVSKSNLKKKIWCQAEFSPEAIRDIELLNRRGPYFTLDELSNLVDWLVWNDAAADGHEATPLTEWRDRQSQKRYQRAVKNIANLRALEAATPERAPHDEE